MRLSTALEVIGFAALTYAIYRVNATAGIAVAGVVLLLIAYATEDDQATASLVRMVAPARIRWERAKANHRTRKEARLERRQARYQRRTNELVLRVKD